MRNKKVKPIIIVGFGRSGTSVIADVLFRHNEMAYLSNYNDKLPKCASANLVRFIFDNKLWRLKGEKPQLNKVGILNKVAFKPAESYRFLNEITGREFGRSFLHNQEEEEAKAQYIRSNFERLARFQGREWLGFKFTGPTKVSYLHSIFPEALFIYVQRNPLPNINSLLNVGFYQGRQQKLWWQGEGIYTQEELDFADKNKDKAGLIAALQFFKIRQIHDREIVSCGIANQVHTINYEEFVLAPEKVITRALEFLGLSLDKQVEKFLKKSKIENRNQVNKVYFSEEEDREIEKVALHGVHIPD